MPRSVRSTSFYYVCTDGTRLCWTCRKENEYFLGVKRPGLYLTSGVEHPDIEDFLLMKQQTSWKYSVSFIVRTLQYYSSF
jgi:hypothetical protein